MIFLCVRAHAPSFQFNTLGHFSVFEVAGINTDYLHAPYQNTLHVFVYLSPLCIAANLSLSRFCWLHADCARWFICLWSKHGLCANMQFVLFFPSGQQQTGSFHNHILMPVKATAFLLQSKKPGLQSPSQHTNQEKGGWLNSVCSSANILKGLHSPPWCWMHLHLFL